MPTTVVRRLYVYAAAFLGLQLLAAGARGLLSALLEPLLAAPAVGRPEESVVRLSLHAALLIVGLPLWAGHWSWAQRRARHPEEQHSGVRRLYAYLVLAVAMLGLLVASRDLLSALLRAQPFAPVGALAATATGAWIVNALVWGWHWRVFAADRDRIERTGMTATLRRWYLVIVQAVSLGVAGYAAVDLLQQLLQLGLVPALGSTSGLRMAVATLLAGLLVWLPHHFWARSLVRTPTVLCTDEACSTLRQVYAALVITATTVAALGGLATLLYAVLLATLGAAAWRALLVDHTQALAVVLVAAPLWTYHRAQLTAEACLSAVQARVDTARRVIGYLSAAIGLVALFFGLGGLLSTLLRLVLAPDVLGAGWRAALSLSLALSVVALPAYGIAARAMEQLARTSLVEERTLARRVFLYAALLFGLVAAISAAVTVLRLTLGALLGAAEPALAAEIGSWLSYTLVGAAIAGFYAMRLRWTTGVPAHAGAGLTIAIVAGAAFTPRLVAALERELPGARLQVADLQEPAQAGAALVGADILVAALAAAFDSPAAAAIRTFSGRRLLLATDVPGYELVSTRGDDALAREAAHLLRMQVQSAPAATVTIAQPSVANP